MERCKSNVKELLEAKRKLESNQTELSFKELEIEDLKKNQHKLLEAKYG